MGLSRDGFCYASDLLCNLLYYFLPSLTLIKGKGLLLPVNLHGTGAFIQNQALILEKTKR